MMWRILTLSLFMVFPFLCRAGGAGDLFLNRGRGYGSFRHATAGGIVIDNKGDSMIADTLQLPEGMNGFSLTFTARDDGGESRPSALSRKTPAWGFFIFSPDGELWITVKRGEGTRLLSTASEMRITVERNGESLGEATVSEGFDTSGGPNVWRLTAAPGELVLAGGNHGLRKVIGIPLRSGCSGFGFAAAPGGYLLVSDVSLRSEDGDPALSATLYDRETLKKLLENPSDSIEGIWAVFDRTLEETLLRSGGDYRLAIVRNGESFDIVYLSGAKVNASAWREGMLKGRLHPSPFEGIFHLEWIDSEGKTLSHEIDAQTGDDRTLQIQFPYHSSVMRLRKIRQ